MNAIALLADRGRLRAECGARSPAGAGLWRILFCRCSLFGRRFFGSLFALCIGFVQEPIDETRTARLLDLRLLRLNGSRTMIDLAALAALFFDASKEWTEPKVARFDPLSDAEKEEVVLNLQKRGHELQWVRDARLRALKRAGWAPVYERDAIGRPTIFTDRLQELVLIHRPPWFSAH